MVEFAVNTYRFDPYKNFKFRVQLDGRYVPGVSRISPLIRQTAPLAWRSGGAPNLDSLSPGKTSFAPITLERGLTHDPTFEDWADKAFNLDGDAGASLKDFRKDMIIELMNLNGQIVHRYFVYRCWVSEYQALPELDANDDASIAIERIVLQHGGWTRDKDVKEPQEG